MAAIITNAEAWLARIDVHTAVNTVLYGRLLIEPMAGFAAQMTKKGDDYICS
jgi:hypothetical protein